MCIWERDKARFYILSLFLLLACRCAVCVSVDTHVPCTCMKVRRQGPELVLLHCVLEVVSFVASLPTLHTPGSLAQKLPDTFPVLFPISPQEFCSCRNAPLCAVSHYTWVLGIELRSLGLHSQYFCLSVWKAGVLRGKGRDLSKTFGNRGLWRMFRYRVYCSWKSSRNWYQLIYGRQEFAKENVIWIVAVLKKNIRDGLTRYLLHKPYNPS